MLIILLHLFLNFQVITGDEKVPAKFNEAELIEKRHQQVLQVNAYIDGFRQRINDQRKLEAKTTKAAKLKQTLEEDKFLDYDNTHIWWTLDGEDHGRNPETTFFPTPLGHNRIPTGYTRPKDVTFQTMKTDIQNAVTPSTRRPFPSFITRPSLPKEFPSRSTRDSPLYPSSTPPSQEPSTESTCPTVEVTSPSSITPESPYPTIQIPASSKFPSWSFDYIHPTSQIPTSSKPPSSSYDYHHPTTQLPATYKLSSWSYDYHQFDFSLTPTPVHPEYSEIPHKVVFPTPDRQAKVWDAPIPSTHLPVETDGKRPWETTIFQGPAKETPILSDIVKSWVKKRTNQTVPSFGNDLSEDFDRHTRARMALPRQGYRFPTPYTKSTKFEEQVPLGHAMFGNASLHLFTTTETTTTLAYQYMMDALHEGYLVVFLVELMALVALKETDHVQEVIKQSYNIIDYFLQNGYLYWLDWPLSQIVQDLSKFLSTNQTDAIQSHAKIVYRILLERRQAVSDEVNTIIDYAQSLYAPWEGKNLFDSIKGFGDFPTTNVDGYWTCNNLIQAFLSPYDRLGNGDARRRLVDMVNKALLARFPQYVQPQRRVVSLVEDKEDSPETKHVERRSIKTTKKSKLHNRHERRHYKTKLKSSTQSRNYDNRRQYRPRIEYEYPMLRSLKPIRLPTTIQRRYHIVTSKYHFRQMNIKPTTNYVNLMTRPTKPINYVKGRHINRAVLKNSSKVNYKRHMNNDDDKTGEVVGAQEVEDGELFYRQMKERFKALYEAKSVKLKAELLRKVVEGSSYSDEEADLKMNLIQALLLKNKTVGGGIDKPKL